MDLKYFIVAILFIWLFVLRINKRELEKRRIDRSPVTLIWRTEKGLKAVDLLAKKIRKFWIALGSFAAIISIPLMFLVLLALMMSAGDILLIPGTPAGVAPVIPGIKIPGSPIFLPLGYGLIALATVMIFHELSHGIIVRAEEIRAKSSGVFFLTVIPLGAFIEPDEEELEKKPTPAKLRVYAAGSFGNFLVAVFSFILITALIVPGFFQQEYISIVHITPGSPAEKYGLEVNSTLISINGIKVNSLEEFSSIVSEIKPNQKMIIETEKGKTDVTAAHMPEPDSFKEKFFYKIRGSENRGYIGMAVVSNISLKSSVESLLGDKVPLAIYEGFSWIFLLNLFIGLTNLLPLNPLDGGKIFRELIAYISPKSANTITNAVSLMVAFLIIINMSPLFLVNLQ